MIRLVFCWLLIASLLLPVGGGPSFAEGTGKPCPGFFAKIFEGRSRQRFEGLKELNRKSIQDYFSEGISEQAISQFKRDFDELLNLRARFEKFPKDQVRESLEERTGSRYPSLDPAVIKKIYMSDRVTLRELQDFALLNAVEDSIVTRKKFAQALSGRSAKELLSLSTQYSKKLALGFWNKSWQFLTYSAVTAIVLPVWMMISQPATKYVNRINPAYEGIKETKSELATLTQEVKKDDFSNHDKANGPEEQLKRWKSYELQYEGLYKRLQQQINKSANAMNSVPPAKSQSDLAQSDALFLQALSALDAQEGAREKMGPRETKKYGVPTDPETSKIALLADWEIAAISVPELTPKGSISEKTLTNSIDQLARRGLLKNFIADLTAKLEASLKTE